MNGKSWAIFSAIAIGLLTLLVVTSKNSESSILNGIDIYAVQTASDKNGDIADHVFGETDSKVTLIEYGDYQCPPCASIYPIVKSITTEYADKVRFIFRNFPIPTLHQNALTAASVAEAAGLQGKFWEMHDILYENQNSWSELSTDKRIDYFANLAEQIGIDSNQLKKDITLNTIAQKIDYDKALSKKTGVEGTPSFYLNGKALESKVVGDATKLKAALDAELKK